MLNGSGKAATASSRARLVAISPADDVPPDGVERRKTAEESNPGKADPQRMHWLVVPSLTLGSALAGGAAAWFVR